jgi:hypothetical protein
MILTQPHPTPEVREYAVWLITLLVIAAGFRYAKEIIAFVLDKLYEYFIQNQSSSI